MIEILAIVVPVLGSIAVAVITAITSIKINKIETAVKQNSSDSEIRNMVLGIGQVTLVNECRRYINEGHIDKDEYEALRDHMYNPYKALGGNSTGDLWFSRVENMYARELK